MLDIKFVRENPDAVKENIKKKFQDAKLPLVDEVIEKDAKYRAALKEVEALKAARNKLSKANGPLFGQLKKCTDEAQKAELQAQIDANNAAVKADAASLALRSVEQVARIRIPSISTGSTAPLSLFVSCARPRLKPFLSANAPVPTPSTKPINATHAFRSPADIRITIRSGQPRKIREPIIITIPRIKRIIGEDPAVERYSFVATEIINAPITRPMISGLAYCTTSAW